MVKISEEDIRKATSVNILSFCDKHGIKYERVSGTNYSLETHDSCMLSTANNTFYWYSRGYGGDTIKFAREFAHMSFPEAVQDLLENEYSTTVVRQKPKEKEPFRYYFQNQQDKTKAIRYLTEERKISKDIVSLLEKKGFLQQVKMKDHAHNEYIDAAAFVWAKNSRVVGASLQGVDIDFEKYGKRGTTKKIAMNPEQHFGFNVCLGTPQNIYVFESPIDLLSYWSMHPELNNCLLADMEGLKFKSVIRFIEYAKVGKGEPNLEKVYMCTDNDLAANRFFSNYAKLEKFERLVPFDNAVPSKLYEEYESCLSNLNSACPIELVCAFHKAEMSFAEEIEWPKYTKNDVLSYFVEQEELSHYYDSMRENPSSERPGKKPVDVREAVKKITKDFDGTKGKGLEKIQKMVQSRSNYPEKEVYDFAYKVNYFYNLYKNKGIETMEHVPKDWNDVLKASRQQEQSKEFPNRMLKNEKNQQLLVEFDSSKKGFTASLIDKQKKMPFFEADSMEEAEFLAKNYGYFAVDREDQQKYFGKKQTAETKTKIPVKEREL